MEVCSVMKKRSAKCPVFIIRYVNVIQQQTNDIVTVYIIEGARYMSSSTVVYSYRCLKLFCKHLYLYS